MSVSPILEIPTLSESMAQKTLAINMALQCLESALSGRLVVDTSAATSAGYNLALPFDDINDLSERQALRAIYIELEAGATNNFLVTHPSNPHFFIAKNSTGYTATFKTASGTTADIGSGDVAMLHCDGSNFTRFDFTVANLRQAYDLSFNYYGTPENDELIGRVFVARDVDFQTNFAGSACMVGTNPTATVTLSVAAGSTVIGSLSIATSGAVTFTLASPYTLTAGTVLNVYNQSVADTTLADISIVFAGYVVTAQ